MWVGEDGIVRTAALADPSQALGESLRARLNAMPPGDVVSLSLALDDLTEFEVGDFRAEDDEVEYEGQFLPDDVRVELSSEDDVSAESLTQTLEAIGTRWRLDVTLALIDYLDSLSGD